MVDYTRILWINLCPCNKTTEPLTEQQYIYIDLFAGYGRFSFGLQKVD